MSLPTDAGNATPSSIQEFDGFDVQDMDTSRWNTPTEVGSTEINQTGGDLVFTNTGAGTKGISFIETVRKFGKNWRISLDMCLETTTGSSGEISLVLYKNSTCYIKIGPYKSAAVNCDCYLRYKNGATPEVAVELTNNLVDSAHCSTYTFAIISDTILIYYKGVFTTSIPMSEIYNFTIRIEAGTGANADTIVAKANDYEIRNNIDTLLITIGQLVRDMHDTLGAGIATAAVLTDISGNIILDDTTEHFLTFGQATYGTKFKVNLFADLEGANIDYCHLYKSATTAFTDQSILANSMQSNTVRLLPSQGAAVGDCIYFGNEVLFHRLDVYMEQGTSNTKNTFVWEYWNGAAWAALTVTDGTVYNSKIFGKSGKVTWVTDISKTTINTINTYWVRARLSVLDATNLPIASHIQVSEDGEEGFDSLAEFVSSLLVRIYRKRGDGSYATLPVDMTLPLTQCVLYRNMEASNVPAWTDIKIGFKLSVAPTATITIPYTGFIETIET